MPDNMIVLDTWLGDRESPCEFRVSVYKTNGSIGILEIRSMNENEDDWSEWEEIPDSEYENYFDVVLSRLIQLKLR